MKSPLLRPLLLGALLSFNLFSTAFGIVSRQDDLTAAQTPLLVSGLETEIPAYKAYYQTQDFRYFHFEFTEYVKPAPDYFGSFKADPDKVMAEISLASESQYDSKPHAIIEFERIQKDIVSRGFEPSKNTFWAEPKSLDLSYDLTAEDAGPHFEKFSNGTSDYSHAMSFELDLRYEPKGKVLSDGDDYPEVYLKGYIAFTCEQPEKKCHAVVATFDEAGIRWRSIPTFRGAGSSAGGK